MGKEATGLIPLVNNLCFFVTYTIFRIVLFPWLIASHIQSGKLYDLWNKNIPMDASPEQLAKKTTFTHQVCWITLVSFFFMVLLLNLFWYSLIIRGLIKII